MHRFLGFSLALLLLPACLGHSHRGRRSHHASEVDLLVTGVVLVATIVDAAKEPPPPPSPEPYVEPIYPFDRDGARAALQSVKYLDCGMGGVADLSVTFKPSGAVREVTLDDGELDEDTSACVMKRFGAVRVPRFTGVPRSMRIRIRLYEATAM